MNQHPPESLGEPSDDPVAVDLSHKVLVVKHVHPEILWCQNSNREWVIHMPIIDGLVWWQNLRCPICNVQPQINDEPEILSAEVPIRSYPPMVQTQTPAPSGKGADAWD